MLTWHFISNTYGQHTRPQMSIDRYELYDISKKNLIRYYTIPIHQMLWIYGSMGMKPSAETLSRTFQHLLKAPDIGGPELAARLVVWPTWGW